MASNGFINFDAATAKYSMSDAQATFFVDKSHPNHSIMGAVLIAMASCEMRGRLMGHFQNGGGYTYKEVSISGMVQPQQLSNGAIYDHHTQMNCMSREIMHQVFANLSDNSHAVFQMPPDAVLGCKIFFGPVYEGLLPMFVAKLDNGESSFDFLIRHIRK